MLSDSDLRDENKMRDLMGQKYEKKRWYVHPTEEFYEDARKQNACSTQKHSGIKPISTLVGHNLPALNVSANQVHCSMNLTLCRCIGLRRFFVPNYQGSKS